MAPSSQELEPPGNPARFTATLLIGLTLYTSALIAEIVRSGIVSVDKGQIEAARALGFHEFRILKLVTLPLAIRVIVPPDD